ncbi:N-acetylmuramoyl-L-alanine amidase [Pseudarthrobacter equi]|uniref:N-acetylmuramoyl-L-alanine amidase n=1 Tax=Pseudarthrobacter equi TaxID=728066 RepID=A0A1H2AAB9_9MICC|nr:peptidoglycan recognition family protein [Pseudarthrobacter equi]SDT42446.1 N-acetylmuramoyl-L-alanine amidase [Pseudarthrobacter equi]
MAYKLETQYNSPNFTAGSSVPSVYGMLRLIDYITIHWWGEPSLRPSYEGVVAYLCRQGGNTSAHEVIEAGRVAVIIDHINAAWHAGNATGNARSIGLELNPRASEGDYQTAAERVRDLWAFYGEKPLKAHRDWFSTACPGVYDLAKLERLAKGSFGVPTPTPVVAAPAPVVTAPAPAAPVVASGKRLTLPASATGWNIYPLNRPPVNGMQVGKLNPSLFGGLTYDIIRMNQPAVAVIRTRDFGEVQIYVGPETGAVISGAASAPAPTPIQPVPAPAAPSAELHSRTVTNAVAWVRTGPRADAPTAPGYPEGIAKGATLSIRGFVAGQDPYNNGNDAWYVTRSGFFVWANAAGNSLAGLPKLN